MVVLHCIFRGYELEKDNLCGRIKGRNVTTAQLNQVNHEILYIKIWDIEIVSTYQR